MQEFSYRSSIYKIKMFHSESQAGFQIFNWYNEWTLNSCIEILSFIPFNNGNSLISFQKHNICLSPLQQVFCVTEALCVQGAGLHEALHGPQFSPQACQDGAWR